MGAIRKGATPWQELLSARATEPARYVIDGKEHNQPFCDGSHKLTRGEERGKLYWYDKTGKRHDVAGEFPDIRAF